MEKKERKELDACKLDMTPMIDCVFQLIIFFVVTLKQEDILSKLEVSRPAGQAAAPEEQVSDLLTIQVHATGYILNGRSQRLPTIEKQLGRLAKISKNVSVIIKCTGDSKHGNLVDLLDVCAKAGLKNLSVFSM